MSLLDESKTRPEDPKARSAVPYLLAGIAALAAVVAIGWVLWPSAPPKRVVARTPAPPPVVTPSPPPAPAATPAPVAPRPRPKRREEPVEPAAAPPPATGTLAVESDVPGASVFIDREFKGVAPLTIEGIAPGQHQLNVSAEGFQGRAETIEVGPGPATIAIRFKEVRLNETVAVVHKHAIGSCQGRLVADTDGIRYETANKGDAFVMKHAEVETFEVDYLKKNLRIKRRGGKTYNFTNESADALFVFHKNVAAARARLAKGDTPAR
jgi:hypothetical protein